MSCRLSPLRITSPTAEAARELAERLETHGATAEPSRDGGWEVLVPLLGAPVERIAQALAATQEWLDAVGLRDTSVTLDGKTYSLQSSPGVTTDATA